jgi:hypothetical protein
MPIDKELFIATLGGPEIVGRMDSESRADAMEDFMAKQLETATSTGHFPTVADVEAQIETRPYRMGAGFLFVSPNANMKRLPPMPANPTLLDYFNLRFGAGTTKNHCLQSATRAMNNGMSEEIILACLLHDTGLELMRTDHGWWGAQLYEPYVSEKVAFAIRYHQALRFYPDKEAGYEYPALYRVLFGEDYVPPPHIEASYKMLRNHKWYMEPRMVTVNDFYSFDRNAVVTIEPFLDILGRHFKQPKEGLGNDNSPGAHMWRAIARPDSPL